MARPNLCWSGLISGVVTLAGNWWDANPGATAETAPENGDSIHFWGWYDGPPGEGNQAVNAPNVAGWSAGITLLALDSDPEFYALFGEVVLVNTGMTVGSAYLWAAGMNGGVVGYAEFGCQDFETCSKTGGVVTGNCYVYGYALVTEGGAGEVQGTLTIASSMWQGPVKCDILDATVYDIGRIDGVTARVATIRNAVEMSNITATEQVTLVDCLSGGEGLVYITTPLLDLVGPNNWHMAGIECSGRARVFGHASVDGGLNAAIEILVYGWFYMEMTIAWFSCPIYLMDPEANFYTWADCKSRVPRGVVGR